MPTAECTVCHRPRARNSLRRDLCGGCEDPCSNCGLVHDQPTAYDGIHSVQYLANYCVRAMAIKLGFREPPPPPMADFPTEEQD